MLNAPTLPSQQLWPWAGSLTMVMGLSKHTVFSHFVSDSFLMQHPLPKNQWRLWEAWSTSERTPWDSSSKFRFPAGRSRLPRGPTELFLPDPEPSLQASRPRAACMRCLCTWIVQNFLRQLVLERNLLFSESHRGFPNLMNCPKQRIVEEKVNFADTGQTYVKMGYLNLAQEVLTFLLIFTF